MQHDDLDYGIIPGRAIQFIKSEDKVELLTTKFLSVLAECQLNDIDYSTLRSYAENKWRLVTGYSALQCGRLTMDKCITDEFTRRGWIN